MPASRQPHRELSEVADLTIDCDLALTRESRHSSSYLGWVARTKATAVPDGPEWLHEIKYDGFRLRVERDGDRVRLITRGGYNWTKKYPWIVEASLKNRQKHFVIDGEAVILGVDGISDFNALHSGKHNEEVQLCAFDVLAMDGDDLRDLPLSMRKANLARLSGHSGNPALRRLSMKRTRSSARRSGGATRSRLPSLNAGSTSRKQAIAARASTIRSERALAIAATRNAVAQFGCSWSPGYRLVVTTSKSMREGHAG